MNAPLDPDLLAGLETPEFLKPKEPPAIYAWFSTRRLLVVKDGAHISLSADDVRALARFVESCNAEGRPC